MTTSVVVRAVIRRPPRRLRRSLAQCRRELAFGGRAEIMVGDMREDAAALAPLGGFELLHGLRPGVGAETGPHHEPPDDGRPPGPVIGTCTDAARAALATSMTVILEVLAGRRRPEGLRAASVDERVHAGLRHRIRAGGMRGAALRTLHPSARPCGTRVEFVGSYAHAGRVRALAGAMIDDGRGWTITALRFL